MTSVFLEDVLKEPAPGFLSDILLFEVFFFSTNNDNVGFQPTTKQTNVKGQLGDNDVLL